MMAASFMSVLPVVLLFAAAVLLVVAAVTDVASRTIPNAIPLGTALLGAVLRGLDGTLGGGLIAAAVVFGSGAVCWHRGWMGGGDVKLLGALALVVPPRGVLPLLTWIAIAGGVLAIAYLLARRLLPRPVLAASRNRNCLARILRAEHWRIARGAALPYAVAIAVGALISF
jgi:prepilin peptidase CpaA